MAAARRQLPAEPAARKRLWRGPPDRVRSRQGLWRAPKPALGSPHRGSGRRRRRRLPSLSPPPPSCAAALAHLLPSLCGIPHGSPGRWRGRRGESFALFTLPPPRLARPPPRDNCHADVGPPRARHRPHPAANQGAAFLSSRTRTQGRATERSSAPAARRPPIGELGLPPPSGQDQ